MRFFLSVLVAGALCGQAPPKPEPEDPGPPVLKRGGTKERKPPSAGPDLTNVKVPPPGDPGTGSVEAPPGETAEHPSSAPARAASEDLIERAREASFLFNDGLPNFICDQLTIRSSSQTRDPIWKVKDRVEVELLYLEGKEEYRNIRINGKATKKSPEEVGQWSSGDFGTTLVDVLSTSTNANFKRRGRDQVTGIDTVVYDYSVEQPNSHWQIRYGRAVRPAYKGALWIDPVSARVLRIEMNTRKLPADYEIDTVEMTLEYGWVTIAGEKFLLPVKSENLSCLTHSYSCSKNELQFRNYRKFAVESSISTTESSVSFEGAEPPKPVETAPPKEKKKKKP